MEAVCYLGAPLLDGEQQVIGVLCIISDRPLANEENAKAIITVFAARAAAELQRQRAKSALRCAYEELEIRVNEATQGLRQRTAELVKANAALETEVQEKIAAESALRTSETRLRKQQAGLLKLAKNKSIYEGNFSEALGIEYENEETLTDASGTTRTISKKKIAFADASGNQALVGIIRDITERKRAEEDLRQMAERERAISRVIPIRFG